MHEFELLPTEEQMRDMVREFHQVEMRRDIMAGAMCSPRGKDCKAQNRDTNIVDNYSSEDMCDQHRAKACTKAVVAKIQKAYYLQCDIEQALKRLHSVAPPIYRQEIGELIKTKRDNTQQLLTVYSQLIGDVVSYAPTLYNGRNFCKTLLDICTMQEKLLNCLIGTEECTGALWLVSREIVVATTLTRMSIFCLFNR